MPRQGTALALSFLTTFMFLAFISHYKEEAGTDARLLKLLIVQCFVVAGFPLTENHIFLDSDDLYDLSKLL